MYPISDAFKAAMRSRDWTIKLNIEIIIGSQSYYLTEDNVLDKTFVISNKCSGSENVEIGKVDIAEMTATFIKVNLPRYSLKGAEIIPQFQLLTGSDFESVPLGKFTISEANWTIGGVEVTAYDNMSLFDKTISITSGSGYIYDFVILACRECGVTCGMTGEEMQALPNGTEYINLYPGNDIETWRDLIAWCALHTACFATMNRAGELVFRSYSQVSVDEVDDEHRINGAKFSDFQTKYTAVSVVDDERESTDYYALETDNGLTYELGSDPFMQTNSAARERMARNILNALALIDYVPFEVSMASASIVYDLGDVLTFTNGIADGSKRYCITQFDWTYGEEYYARGVGQNPALSNARGKTDKAITGLNNRVDKDTFRQDVIQNLREVSVADKTLRRILRASIMTKANASVMMNAEILLTAVSGQTGADVIASITYQLDGEIIERNPVETWSNAGRHILKLLHLLSITESGFHTFDIFVEMSGGSIEIAPYDILCIFSGIGIVANPEWNGQIELEEDAALFPIPTVPLADTMTDQVQLSMITPLIISVSDAAPDTFDIPEPAFDTAGLTETIRLIRQLEQSRRATEDGDERVTEDGDIRYSEEER